MIARINRLLIVLLLLSLALYVVVMNWQVVTVSLSQSTQYSLSLGIVMISAFCLGLVITMTFATIWALKAYFRERALLARERQKQLFLDKLIEARSASSLENWDYARLVWEQLLKQNPSSLIGRIELSRAEERSGDITEALRLVDLTRAEYPSNAEALFRGVELHLALGNKTAAVDQLSLILAKHKSKKAARLAMQICEDLDQIDRALEFHAQLESLGEHSHERTTRLRFKKLLQEKEIKPEEYKKELHNFLKKYPQSVEALVEVAVLEQEVGRYDEAVQFFLKAGKASGKIQYWRDAVDIWLSRSKPEKALAVARTAKNDLKGETRLQAELLGVRLQLQLAMLPDAYRGLEGVEEGIVALVVPPSREILAEYLALRALYFQFIGNFEESSETLKKLDNLYTGLKTYTKEPPLKKAVGEAPAPHLSTP